MMERMEKTLVVGYGNVDRQDDGAAWHLLARLASRLAETQPVGAVTGSVGTCHEIGYANSSAATLDPDLGLELDTPAADLRFVLQLTPELAESMANYERVCFVDAHTQTAAPALQAEAVAPDYRPSVMTHHMSPATCLAICQTIYGRQPQTLLVSVRGYEFGFSRKLSPATLALLPDAEKLILDWIQPPQFALEPSGEAVKFRR